MRSRVFAVLVFSIVMAMCLVPGTCFAADASNTGLVAGDINKTFLNKQSADYVDGGTFGSCYWDIYDSDGERILYIEPISDDYGYLDSSYVDEEIDGSTTPWYSYSNSLDVVIVTGHVYAGESCAALFCDCPNVWYMGLAGLDTSGTSDMSYMFYGCSSLQTIFVSNLWSKANVEYSTGMFYQCNSLVGGNGTPFDSDYDDALFANVDYSDDPGYLTSLYMGDASISLSSRSYTYNSRAQQPTATVTIGTTTLREGEDFTVSYKNNVNAGTATVVITGMGIYESSKSATFTIKPASLSSATLSSASLAYNGKAIKPAVKTVKAGGLTVGASGYSVAYSKANPKTVGTYKVTITGKGNFTGSKTVSYKITQAKNKAVAKKTSVKKTIKASVVSKKAKLIALPKVTTKFGKAKWTVTKKDKSKTLSLSGSKIKVKKGAKKGTYTIKLKAKVKKTKNYKAATSKVVTVKVTVK